MSGIFTAGEIEYMATQPLGRLATQQRSGTLQVSPVSFYFNAARESIDIGGRDMADSQKFRNVAHNSRAAFVVDDIASLDPWRVRCLDIRGHAAGASTRPRSHAADGTPPRRSGRDRAWRRSAGPRGPSSRSVIAACQQRRAPGR